MVVWGGSSNCAQQSLVMCAMTRTATAGLMLEFITVCFFCVLGGFDSRQRTRERGNSGGAKILVVGNLN